MKVTRLNQSLERYVKNNIILKYNNFDRAHGNDHVNEVINRSLKLAKNYDVDLNMVYVIAAYHDIGLSSGRENHEKRSSEFLLKDSNLKKWFSEDQLEVMANAVEDHRASLEYEPRSIYGKIISEADRVIDPVRTIERTLKFGMDNYKGLTKEEQFERAYNYLIKKYSESGYIKTWLPELDSKDNLLKFQTLLRNKKELIKVFNNIYNKIINENN